MLEFYVKYGKVEGSAIRINGITARLQIHDQSFWMKNDSDLETKPDLKEYYAIFIPCIYCNNSWVNVIICDTLK